jgi:thiol-disulfide isomerase/thioredoxin
MRKIFLILLLIFLLMLALLKFNIFNFEFNKTYTKSNSAKLNISNGSYLKTLCNYLNENDKNLIKGKTIFINAWSSWCPKCYGEIKQLNAIKKLVNDSNIIFLAMCTDLNLNESKSLLMKKKIDFTFTFIEGKPGFRDALQHLVARNNVKLEIDSTVEFAPQNFVINANDSLVYYKPIILEKDINDIIKILNGN